MKDMLKKVFKHWEMFLVIFLILEFVVFGAANPKFLRPQSIMNSIVNYISVCIISLFVTMVMITGGIDIQAPAIIGLSSIIIGVLWSDAGLNIWAAVAIAMVVAALCGALREAAADVGLPADFAQLLHSREDVAAMLDEGVAAYIRRKGLWSPATRIAALGAQIAAEPGNTALLVERGKLHYRMGEWGPALNDFNAALRIDDTHVEAKEFARMVQEILEFRYKDIYNP